MQSRTNIQKTAIIILAASLLAFALNFAAAAPALAASDTLEITGEGVANPQIFTREQLKGMEQHQETYSSINTWPTKKWYVIQGVKLWELLREAGIKEKEATMLKFTAGDSYTVTLTMEELFRDKRYRFPNFKVTGGSDCDGHLPGDPSGKIEVEPLIALSSVEGSDNPSYMNELYTLLLALGQRTVTEQTGNLFVKYLSKIEVLTSQPQKWDEPQANPAGGTVPAGTMVALSNLHTDEDKIHYTTDGSTPTMHSPVYNWIASRWWSSRTDVLGTINRPIGPLNENTTIKAITIGPGKRDSDIATFQYYIDAIGPGSGTAPPKNGAKPADGAKLPEQAARIIELTIGQTAASVNDKPYTLYAAPYINIPAGRMLVPIRFVSEALGAAVKWNPGAKEVTITAKGGEIILTLDSMNALVNGQATILECAPELQNNRTFVPLRFVSETLEAQVEYKAGKVIIIK